MHNVGSKQSVLALVKHLNPGVPQESPVTGPYNQLNHLLIQTFLALYIPTEDGRLRNYARGVTTVSYLGA